MKMTKAVAIFSAFTVAGLAAFLFTGQGATVSCASTRGDLDCYLKKRTFSSGKEDKFSRSEIMAVELSVFTHTSQGKRSNKVLWVIRFKNGSTLPVTLDAVAWPMGNMDLKQLRSLLLPAENTNQSATTLQLVSYGINPWFFGLLAGAIGWALGPIFLARPVRGVTAEVLSKNRFANFVLLIVLSAITVLIWMVGFRVMQQFFLG